jgi:dTDP-4-dehydrorhamnose 3,5-epimerase
MFGCLQNKGVPSIEAARVSGVMVVRLEPHSDDRGRFLETFRQEWFPGAPPMVQASRSDSHRGVIRGLHFHRRQADYWHVPRGRIFAATFDLRRSSPTWGKAFTIEMGDGADVGLYIPAGVAHGFQALTDATLTYLVDNYYDASDEHGLAWDDPDAAIPWPLPDAVISERDEQNPKLTEITDPPA